jgi:hypothetical protein
VDKLKPCPCGRVPSSLDITDAGASGKYADVSGNCCGYWEIEFKTEFHPLDSDECMRLAIAVWNDAPRGGE